MLMILITCLFCGCYPDWPEQPTTAVVHGTILLDGAPVNEAQVVFVPENVRSLGDEIMPLAYGTTDADGKFELTYADGTKELFPGIYMVMVSKIKSALNATEDSGRPWPVKLLPDSVARMTVFSEQGETIPSIYNRESTLTYEVIASPRISRPKFELSSVDPELKKANGSE